MEPCLGDCVHSKETINWNDIYKNDDDKVMESKPLREELITDLVKMNNKE